MENRLLKAAILFPLAMIMIVATLISQNALAEEGCRPL